MSVIELSKELPTTKAQSDGQVEKVSLEKVSHEKTAGEKVIRAAHPRYDKRSENTLYQGIILLGDGQTVSMPAAERFRMLRAKIERINLGDQRYNVLAVTSAIPQEGKSVTSVNLARALSVDPFGKTLLIDCDLRRPTVHNYFQVPREGGLSDVLTGKYLLRAVIRPVAAGLDVVTAGSAIDDPTQAIEQPELVRLIEELKKEYRYIVLDCPPVLVCPEPITLSMIAEGTLLVVRAWRTERRLVEEAAHVIGKSRILGVVLNDGIDASKQYLDYGYYGYQARSETSINSSKK